MTPNYESEWIDQFIDALLRDPNASAPPELDDETVNLLRSLVRKPSLQAVQDRVWIRARLAAQHKPSSNGNHSHTTQVRMEEPVNISIARPQPRAVAFSYTLIAAVIAVVLMGTLFIVFGSDDPLSPAAPQRETPTMIPTSTPLENVILPDAPTEPSEGPTMIPGTALPPMGSPVDPSLMPGTALPPSPVSTGTPIGMQMYPITLGGMAETGELRPDAPVMSYTFSVEKAQNVVIFVLSNSFVPQISTSVITENGGGGGGGGGGPLPAPPVSMWNVIAMPDRSLGTITLGSADNAYGPFTISVQPLSTEAEIGYGETIEGRLSLTRPMMLYAFEGHSGDSITATVNSGNSLNSELALYDPQGHILQLDYDSGAGVNPELPETILTADGIYSLGVAVSIPEQEGSFELTVNLNKTVAREVPQPDQA
ncbi:MAG TPA: hypothetical protein VHP83_20445, partial [Aggregatilineaceae bacterium]|nr:hypothetical protein [Aggregatilineaceae bacterium]